MKQKELISVIVPIYNVEACLPRCIKSIMAQTYRNLEIILVDDGSTDGSGRICDIFSEKDNRIKVIHQKNQGLSAARNSGIKCANGDFLTFVDSDDFLSTNFIKVLYEPFKKSYSTDISICNFNAIAHNDGPILDDNRRFVNKSKYEIIMPYTYMQRTLRIASRDASLFKVVWNKLYRRSLIENVLFRDFCYCEDWDFNLRVFPFARNVAYTNHPLYFYTYRYTSLSNDSKALKEGMMYRIEMLFANYSEISITKPLYQCFSLKYLYRRMTLMKGRCYLTPMYDEVYIRCKKIEEQTKKQYLLNRHINLMERVTIVFLINKPRLTLWLLK